MSLFPQVRYASFWRRFIAYNLDTTLIQFFTIGARILLGNSPFLVTIPQQTIVHYVLTRLVVPYVIGMIIVVACWVISKGQSPGKWMMHIRIVRTDGGRMGIRSAIVRYVGYIASSLVFSLGFLWMNFDKNRQTFHDKFAKTVVIEDGDRRPSVFTYLFGLLFPVLVLLLYAWTLMVANGLVVTPSDVKARYKDIQITYAFSHMRPDVKSHMDKAQSYLDKLTGLNIYNFEDAKTARPIARQAVEELKLARDLDPKNSLVYTKLSIAYSWLDGDPAAQKDYDSAMTAYQIDPEDSHNAYNAGVALIRLERYQEAVDMFKKAIALDHTDAYSYQSLGVAYEDLKQYQNAKGSFVTAIDLYKKQNANGKYDHVINDLEKSVSTMPVN